MHSVYRSTTIPCGCRGNTIAFHEALIHEVVAVVWKPDYGTGCEPLSGWNGQASHGDASYQRGSCNNTIIEKGDISKPS